MVLAGADKPERPAVAADSAAKGRRILCRQSLDAMVGKVAVEAMVEMAAADWAGTPLALLSRKALQCLISPASISKRAAPELGARAPTR